jgi:hypothetical protein
MRVAGVLKLVAALASRLAREISRVTSALLVLAAVAKVGSMMTSLAKGMGRVVMGAGALLGVVSAMSSTMGSFLAPAVAGVVALGSAFAAAAVGAAALGGPALAVLKIGMKGLSDATAEWTKNNKTADAEFNEMIGNRMGPLLGSFRELRMEITDRFSTALTGAFVSGGTVIDRLKPKLVGLSDTLGRIGTDVMESLAGPKAQFGLNSMVVYSNKFFASLVGGESGLGAVASSLASLGGLAAKTFANTSAGLNDLLFKVADWIDALTVDDLTSGFEKVRDIFGTLQQVFTNVMSVAKPLFEAFRQLGAESATTLAPGFRDIGAAIQQAIPGLMEIARNLMPALSQVMSNLAPLLPALVEAFTPWSEVLAAVAPHIASIITFLGPMAPFLLAAAGAVKLFSIAMIAWNAAMFVSSVAQGVFAAATGASTASLAGNTIAMAAHRVATLAGAAASYVFGAALRFAMGPIGLIITAIAGLVTGFVLLYKNNEGFRDFIQKTWEVIKNAIASAWTGFIKPAFDAIVVGIKWIGDAALWLWNSAILPAFNGIQAAIGIWWAAVQIYFNAAKTVVFAIGDAAMWLWNTAIVPAFNGIKAAAALWWTGVQVYFNFVKGAFQFVGDAAMWLWNVAIMPAFNGISMVISAFWASAQVVLNAIKAGFEMIGTAAGTAKDWVVEKFNAMVEWVGGLGASIATKASGMWDGFKEAFKSAINFIIDGWNKIEFKVPGFKIGPVGYDGFTLGLPDIPRLASGGVIGGPGTPTSDEVLGRDKRTGAATAWVSAKERVMSYRSRNLGDNDAIQAAMNAGLAFNLPMFAAGGVVGEPYGLPAGSSIEYGGSGFPDWVNTLGGNHSVKPSTYPGHQEGDRNEPGYAPNPNRLNRGIDWSGTVAAMHGFARYLIGIAPQTEALEQIIWMNPESGEKIGWAGRSADTSGSYFASDYSGHQDHVHTRQSASFGVAPPEPPLHQVEVLPTDPSAPDAATASPSTSGATSADPQKTFSGRDRFKKLFTDLGGIAADSLIEIVGVGEWLDLADRYTIKASDTDAPSNATASPGGTTPNGDVVQLQAVPEPPPAPTSGPGFYSHEIARAAQSAGLDRLAAVIGHMTALVEVGDPLKMFANYAIPESLTFPHDAVGSDHDSIGLFQQRPGWGTVAQRMNPFDSAMMFYDKLDDFDFHSVAPGDAAQRVQRSAFPDKYAGMQGRADQLVNETGLFDNGGVLMPNTFAYNGLNEPEMVLKQDHWGTAEAAIKTVKDLAMSGARSGGGNTTVVNAIFRDDKAFYEEQRRNAKLGMTRYGGRRARR